MLDLLDGYRATAPPTIQDLDDCRARAGRAARAPVARAESSSTRAGFSTLRP